MNTYVLTVTAALLLLFAPAVSMSAEPPPALKQPKSLFDGRTLSGWEGSAQWWRVEDGCLTGGSFTRNIPQNEFLATTRDYTNFVVHFKIRLRGTNGFINSGFQIRSQRVPGSSEMAGYQCDFGEPTWYGAIYDESRRNKLMASSDMKRLRPVIKVDGWHDYVIRADGPRITTWINGVMGVDYHEPDLSIPNYDWGKLGIQVHGGGAAVVQVKDLLIEELPAVRKFEPAPQPPRGAKAPPLTPDEQGASFTLSPGFEIQLVLAEDFESGAGKFVAVDWDQQGRLWTMTAREYPVDANETPEVARALYASRARDQVLVLDRDPQSSTGYSRKARVFAEGLAIPLGIMPYRNGAYVQHGPDIVFLSDNDGDGKSDRREVLLTGFGVQDSHLFPHQFTRGPGNWVWMAQGAFNYGKVKTARGTEIQFDQTRMARFRHDGSDFDITSQGPCNIWGLVLDDTGQAWIQEANDFGYPMMPFHEHANYPGCSGSQWKSYAPEFPATATEFSMGGTGLSGLARADRSVWPSPYANQFYIANPITRKIQAIQVTETGDGLRYQKLPDFVLSGDDWFRPVAARFGPDGCLYVVDWYNKIISHNEVPRSHPERDKKRGRVWRVKHTATPPLQVPNFETISPDLLLARLGGESTAQSHMAWQAIVDRALVSLSPALREIALDSALAPGRRVAALWALEGLRLLEPAWITRLLSDPNRHLRREAVRAIAELPGAGMMMGSLTALARDADAEVRQEVARTAGRVLYRETDSRAGTRESVHPSVPLLVSMALPSLAGPTIKSTHSGKAIKTGAAYEREFERYLVRLFLEHRRDQVARFLESPAAASIDVENRLVAALSMDPTRSTPLVAALLPSLTRPPAQEELLRLALFPESAAASSALKSILENAATAPGAIEALLAVHTQVDASRILPLITESARSLWSDGRTRALALRCIAAFKLTAMETELTAGLTNRPNLPPASELTAMLRALRELGASQIEGVLAHVNSPSHEVADEAILALAESRNPRAAEILFKEVWADLNPARRRTALGALCKSRPGSRSVLAALSGGEILPEELDAATLNSLQTVLRDDPQLDQLMQKLGHLVRPVLRLDGSDDAWVDTDINLEGSFTVETWVKLDPGVDNRDGILGVSGLLDMNFFGGVFRVWVGGGIHDAVVSRRKVQPEVWTHISVTRDAEGRFRLYQNGEPDEGPSQPVPQAFEGARVGWTGPKGGTGGWISEFRVWNVARSGDEIRADFDRGYEGASRPAALVRLHGGRTGWQGLQSGARVLDTMDYPPLLTEAEAVAVASRFDRFRKLAHQPGDTSRGQDMFNSACLSCHSVKGQGGQIGPVLNGAGALGVEALLRNLLTPNAAMEPGYRMYRVETRDGDIIDGLRVSENGEAVVLRRPNVEDLRIPQSQIRKAGFTRTSLMPEGLLDGMPEGAVQDLFAYLATLR